MNGLAADAFWTIHITPEAEFSYASFETNLRVPSWTALYQQVTVQLSKPVEAT